MDDDKDSVESTATGTIEKTGAGSGPGPKKPGPAHL
jgi:hypothetical protein